MNIKKILFNAGLFMAAFLVINVGMYFFLKATQPKSVTSIAPGAAVIATQDTTTKNISVAVDSTASSSPLNKEDEQNTSDNMAALLTQDSTSTGTEGNALQADSVDETKPVLNDSIIASDTLPSSEKLAETENIKENAQNTVQTVASGDPKELTKLAKLLDSMKPRDAAAIISDLNVDMIVTLIMKMKDRNAAKMMAEMSPELAARVAINMSDKATIAGRK
jgi:flagellar motility protein MotE (MotC chaperone)